MSKGKVVSILSAKGAVRKKALDTINEISKLIRYQKRSQAHWRFVTTKTSFFPPSGIKNPKKASLGYVTGKKSGKELQSIKENFVPPGVDYRDTNLAQRIQMRENWVGKKAIKGRKELENYRRKIGKAFVEKEESWKKMVKREAIEKIKKMGRAGQRGVERYNAQRRIDARAKGIRFIRKNGRIIPIRPKK